MVETLDQTLIAIKPTVKTEKPIDGKIALSRLLVREARSSKTPASLLMMETAGNVLQEAENGLYELMNLVGLDEQYNEALLKGYAEGMAVSCLKPAGINLTDPSKQLAKFSEAKAISLDYLKEMLKLRTGTPPLPQITPNP